MRRAPGRRRRGAPAGCGGRTTSRASAPRRHRAPDRRVAGARSLRRRGTSSPRRSRRRSRGARAPLPRSRCAPRDRASWRAPAAAPARLQSGRCSSRPSRRHVQAACPRERTTDQRYFRRVTHCLHTGAGGCARPTLAFESRGTAARALVRPDSPKGPACSLSFSRGACAARLVPRLHNAVQQRGDGRLVAQEIAFTCAHERSSGRRSWPRGSPSPLSSAVRTSTRRSRRHGHRQPRRLGLHRRADEGARARARPTSRRRSRPTCPAARWTSTSSSRRAVSRATSTSSASRRCACSRSSASSRPSRGRATASAATATRSSRAATRDGHKIRWADVHHPNLSETKGDYDGQFLFVNDKANARVAVVDLADFATKQIVPNPLAASDHGGAFVTPDTDYVIETSQYPAPLGREYAPLAQYKDKYRGVADLLEVRPREGPHRPVEELGDRAAALHAGPRRRRQARQRRLGVHQLLQHRDGDRRHARGQAARSSPARRQNDMDFLHVINWKKAEELVKAGKTKTIAGMRVLHDGRERPRGRAHAGRRAEEPARLRRHAGRQEHRRRRQARHAHDDLRLREDQGADRRRRSSRARTPTASASSPSRTRSPARSRSASARCTPSSTTRASRTPRVFIESVVAKWSLQGPQEARREAAGPVQHRPHPRGRGRHRQPRRQVRRGDEQDVDRPVRPRRAALSAELPARSTSTARRCASSRDMPIGNGEPHYSQMIKADKLKPIKVYPPGTNPSPSEQGPVRASRPARSASSATATRSTSS